MFFPNIYLILRKVKSSLPNLNFKPDIHWGRTSPFISGSLTLEAACVLPLFVAAMVSVMIFIQGTALSCQISEGIQEAGKEMAVAAYVKEAGDIDIGEPLTGALSYLYAQNKLQEKTGKGMFEVSLINSSIMEENEIIDLVAEYSLKPPISFFQTGGIAMVQRARVRAWTGRKETGNGIKDDKADDNELVYVTVNGSVYHKDRECTHIRLSVKQINKTSVASLRNKSGGKYYPCSGCQGNTASQVYITDTGDRYHSSAGCSGLKRGVISVSLSEISTWSPCSRCGR